MTVKGHIKDNVGDIIISGNQGRSVYVTTYVAKEDIQKGQKVAVALEDLIIPKGKNCEKYVVGWFDQEGFVYVGEAMQDAEPNQYVTVQKIN